MAVESAWCSTNYGCVLGPKFCVILDSALDNTLDIPNGRLINNTLFLTDATGHITADGTKPEKLGGLGLVFKCIGLDMANLHIVDGIRLGVTLRTSLLWKEDWLGGVAASTGYLFYPNPRKY